MVAVLAQTSKSRRSNLSGLASCDVTLSISGAWGIEHERMRH